MFVSTFCMSMVVMVVLMVMMASMAKTMGMGARMVLAHGISP